ncbi:hypothetical protein ACWGK5_27400 [Rhodococcus qingshengii]|uniref:hypothetical protein n=1 Tax=Rhodococcus qingshengii TaxID=334542 RepID=UPI002111DEF6|nr:hypothetical protein [Rhodococcus qingshengii]UUE28785.1 hypothetical protein LRQ08_30550 [Rhodococcus qingshengii]
MDWFVSMWDEDADAHLYRGGAGCDRGSVIEQVVAAGRLIARREDGSTVGVTGKVVIDGTPVDAIAFGDFGVSDDELRVEIGIQFDRVRARAGIQLDRDDRRVGRFPGMGASGG